MIKIGVLTISDRCFKGIYKDESGPAVIKMLKRIDARIIKYEVVPDEIKVIKNKLKFYSDNLKLDIVLTNGGTGFSPRDVTPEATLGVINKVVPGIPEAMRISLLNKNKRAMLSRGVCGIRKKTLVINLPGSIRAVKESLKVILSLLPHSVDMLRGKGH